MKTDLRVVKTLWYLSEVNLDVETDNEEHAKAIKWADENPVAYEIVRSRKSRVFGSLGSFYQGWQRGDSSAAYLSRLAAFHALVCESNTEPHCLKSEPQIQSLYVSRGTFALEHFEDEGYRSGMFQQHALWTDGKVYARSCLELDYGKSTLESQIDSFVVWMNKHQGQTTKITIDGLDARVFSEEVKLKSPKVKKESTRTRTARRSRNSL